jgi:hypothetical protein
VLKEAPDTWFASAIPWTENNSEAFAGTHEDFVLNVFDEASAIPDVIWEVVEGSMTTTGAKWVAFGNPTRNTGRFRECWGRFRHRWHTMQVDSRTAKQADKAQIQAWIDDYGLDSDFIKIRVLGEFPSQSANQFINSADVDSCLKYQAEGFEALPKILAADIARFGDDQSVIAKRQGRKVDPLVAWRGLDFNGGASPKDKDTYRNKRVEVWGLMRDALRASIELPNDPELKQDLIGPEYGFTPTQQLLLERKEDMKKRGLASPDRGDALAMTWAVSPRAKRKPQPAPPPGNWMAA